MAARMKRFAVRVLLVAALSVAAGAQAPAVRDWPVYGGDAGGARFSPLARITRDNVAKLGVAWRYHTGEPALDLSRQPSLQVTPIVVDNVMYISTPLGKVMALEPATGREIWRYDARVNAKGGFGDFASRGVATWVDSTVKPGAPCRRRIYVATVDARLVSLDAASGFPCVTFGVEGTIGLREGLRIPPAFPAAYQVTSPPVIVGDLVMTGAAVADNSRPAPASGEVRAYDARTGALRWTWHPIPQDPKDPAYATWRNGSAERTGAANVWSIMAADPARDLLFVPTSSAAPDYYGALRLGDNRYANSIVALRASTGRVVWHFQTVHHDLWDYDNASPPALVTVTRDGKSTPAVVQATKTGMLFVLHRETGVPIFPVEERKVPASTIPGEEASPTQPFTTVTPPLSPHSFTADQAFGVSPEDLAACKQMMAGLRNDGHLHAAQPRRHDRDAVEYRRRALGRRRNGHSIGHRRCARQPSCGGRSVDSGERFRSCGGQTGIEPSRTRLRVHADGRHAIRHATPPAHWSGPGAVYAAAVRRTRGHQPADRRQSYGMCRSELLHYRQAPRRGR